ncbi:hypothetical protein CPC16_010816 [Podila verticillata]|nr:hypothetical protein CPC16_010816 [Podila verticillata]
METIAQVLHTPYPCYSETTEDKLLFMELHFEDINDELRENAMTLIMVTWLVLDMMLDSLAVTNTPGKYQMTVAISSWQVSDLLNLMRTFERLDKDE